MIKQDLQSNIKRKSYFLWACKLLKSGYKFQQNGPKFPLWWSNWIRNILYFFLQTQKSIDTTWFCCIFEIYYVERSGLLLHLDFPAQVFFFFYTLNFFWRKKQLVIKHSMKLKDAQNLAKETILSDNMVNFLKLKSFKFK